MINCLLFLADQIPDAVIAQADNRPCHVKCDGKDRDIPQCRDDFTELGMVFDNGKDSQCLRNDEASEQGVQLNLDSFSGYDNVFQTFSVLVMAL